MKVAIIDDELNCRDLIRTHLLKIEKKKVEIRLANGVMSGVSLIDQFQPDIVFLDIQMNDGTGFDLLKLVTADFKLVFTTAFDNYAIRAFEFSALHYLLKPVDIKELKIAWDRAKEACVIQKTERESIIDSYNNGLIQKIKLKTENDFYHISLDQILFLEAKGSYCSFCLAGQKNILISKTVKDYEAFLPGDLFFRTHKSYLVNLLQIKQFHLKKAILILKNGIEIPVSRRNKKATLELLLQHENIEIK